MLSESGLEVIVSNWVYVLWIVRTNAASNETGGKLNETERY